MPAICTKCRRTNPADAAFCYFDGTPLSNGHSSGGPVAIARQTFPRPFVFPSGKSCQSFDELALACQEDWKGTRELLTQGHLEQFLGGLGRVDLARVAREAARSADPDRGLDDFLDKLPTAVLDPPRLVVQPQEIHLGSFPVGGDSRFELQLRNRGMRLLRGSARADEPWLALGDGGAPEKLFQFGNEVPLTVRVVGKHLRAGNKTLEGRLVLDSNGGAVTVVIRVDVPIKPFPDGVLRGATTPRQIAEKAKASPREAAASFEKGAVADWYRDNGWIYPVQGPTSSGLGAVQQFFEALGLTPPPKVEVSVRHVNLAGSVGERIDYPLEVKTPEKRPVYASAVSNQPWLKVGKARLDGRVATLPLLIKEVPDRPGEKLQAEVTITANGNQRFPVTVALAVDARSKKSRSVPIPVSPSPFDFSGPSAPREDVPVSQPYSPPPEADPPRRSTARSDSSLSRAATETPREERRPTPMPRTEPREDRKPAEAIPVPAPWAPWWAHVLPLGLLVLALGGVFVADLLRKATAQAAPPNEIVAEPEIDPTPRVKVDFHDLDEDIFLSKNGSVKPDEAESAQDAQPATWEASMRFGLVMVEDGKKLTFEGRGVTNNTVVNLDGQEFIWGEKPWRYKKTGELYQPNFFAGQWKEGEKSVAITPEHKGKGEGRRSVWVYPREKVEVTQIVEIVAGEQSRKLDTCLVRYIIDNQDRRDHRVGIRFLLDTFIGSNDGVPFTIPGRDQLCDTELRFRTPEEVPDFFEAIEREDLSDPGTVARVQLRLGERIEAPSRVTLGAYPNPLLGKRDRRCMQEKTMWEVPVLPIKTLRTADSAVALYWLEKELKPGEKREVGFAYGLGNVSRGDGDSAGRLLLSVGGRFIPNGEFTLTALVSNPQRNETLTLTLPEGVKLVAGSEKQDVPPVPANATRKASPVTWKLKAERNGNYILTVKSSAGAAAEQPVRIKSTSIFD